MYIREGKMIVKELSVVSLSKFCLLSFNIFKNSYLVSGEMRVKRGDVQLKIYSTLKKFIFCFFKTILS